MAGRFIWHELYTTDVKAAIAFYSEVMGWKTKEWEGPGDYTLFLAGERPVGGVALLPEEAKSHGAPPHWLGHVGVDDIEASVAKIKELGGHVAKQEEMPEVGKWAITRDPQGAVFSAFQPTEPMPPGEASSGTVSWNELNTTDWEAAWTFYSSAFGWTEQSRMDMGPDKGTYFMYKADTEHPHGGMSNTAKAHGFPPHWLFYVEIDDIAAAQERVKNAGGEVQGEMDVPGGKIAHCKDPQGVMFAFHQQLEGK